MANDYSVHKVTDQFQDEDKWFYLTKRQIAIILPAILICGGILVTTFKWNILPVGIVLTVIILMFTGVLVLANVPDNKYLFGSGLKMEVILLRLIKKRFKKNQVIYTNNYDNEYKEW